MKLIMAGLFLAVTIGCSNAKYISRTFDAMGNITSEKVISYKAKGSREFKNVKINPETGQIELESASGDAGVLGDALVNSTEALLNSTKVMGRLSGVPIQ
jgi:hypothetical protein